MTFIIICSILINSREGRDYYNYNYKRLRYNIMVATKATTKAKATKVKIVVPKHKLQVATDYRKNIVKSVEGKASSVRDEAGKKVNRQHVIRYTEGEKIVTTTMQIVYGKELLAHKVKNILELTNSKKSVYYFIPLSK